MSALIWQLLVVICFFQFPALADPEEEYQKLRASPSPNQAGQLGAMLITRLRPMQAFYGAAEAEEKQEEFERVGRKETHRLLMEKPVPVVLAPNGEYYILDHHHQIRAASDAGRKRVVVELIEVFEGTMIQFWKRALSATDPWVYPYAKDGRGPLKWDEIEEAMPRTVRGMKNDPYRSLAWYVKHAGGFVKRARQFFVEFKWANFFRAHIEIAPGKEGMKKAVEEALVLSRTQDAVGLPGARVRAHTSTRICRTSVVHNHHQHAHP